MLLDALYQEKLEGAEGRDAELRYVTEHFKDLRGLLWVPLLAGWCFFPIARVACDMRLSTTLLASALLVTAAIAWAVWINRWYTRRYGSIQGSAVAKTETRSGFWAARILSIVILIAISLFHGGSFSVAVVWLWISPDRLLLSRCFEAAPRNRLIRLRRELYTSATVLFYFSLVRHVFMPFHTLPYFPYLSSFCLLGLYDHWLLNHLLRPLSLEVLHD